MAIGIFYSIEPFLSRRRYGHNLTNAYEHRDNAAGFKVDTHMLGKGFWMEASQSWALCYSWLI